LGLKFGYCDLTNTTANVVWQGRKNQYFGYVVKRFLVPDSIGVVWTVPPFRPETRRTRA
jgi:UDP-N-acetyl-D-mannosaminuronic acid transferase (WecB/TagA/CpsF family)